MLLNFIFSSLLLSTQFFLKLGDPLIRAYQSKSNKDDDNNEHKHKERENHPVTDGGVDAHGTQVHVASPAGAL